jgi:hypothetical protein
VDDIAVAVADIAVAVAVAAAKREHFRDSWPCSGMGLGPATVQGEQDRSRPE